MTIDQEYGTEQDQLEPVAVVSAQEPEVAEEFAAVVVVRQAAAAAAVATEVVPDRLGLVAACQSPALGATVADQLAASQVEVRALELGLASQEAATLA